MAFGPSEPRTHVRGHWACLLILAFGPLSAEAQRTPPKSPTSLEDARLDDLRIASEEWSRRPGPNRKVVDQVCLVPDLPTFLAVVSTWDRTRWFPVLIDDTELALKFLKAFRPARVVRYPRAVDALPPERLWTEGVSAVGRAWREPGGMPLDGDIVPSSVGPAPPGVVVTNPEDPQFAAAVALAAGRFQPLLRWRTEKTFDDVLDAAEADRVDNELGRKLLDLVPRTRKLGDDCDFVTLAGDYPYRVTIPSGPLAGTACLDDGLLRIEVQKRRSLFVGRLVGSISRCVYQAMCGLFLQPDSALLFNAYDEKGDPWAEYSMRAAARRLDPIVPVFHRVGPNEATVKGWHDAFGAFNRHDLILLNTSGHPSAMNLAGGTTGQTGDVPATGPVAVFATHSFSAAEPANVHTLAGRWLANGAFVYYGSINEPYLQSFRPPTLAADLIARGLPLGAVARQTQFELFGHPWRLIYLGDPLHRIQPRDRREPRIKAEADDWPVYREPAAPAAGASDDAKLTYALKAAIARAGYRPPANAPDLGDVLLSIDRSKLRPTFRPHHDALLVAVLHPTACRGELIARLSRIPVGEANTDTNRWLETARVTELQQGLARDNLRQAGSAWAGLIRSDCSDELKTLVTARIAAAANTPTKRVIWRDRLDATLKRGDAPMVDALRAELKRVEASIGPTRR